MILGWVWLKVVGGESKILGGENGDFGIFFFSFFFFQFRFDYLYKFVYGFDEFGSRFRKILMILRCVRVVVVVVGDTVLQLVAELGFDFRGGKIYN